MKTTLSAFLMLLAYAAPASAMEFRAENDVAVRAVTGGFEVMSDGGYGARGMWCAAADYARKARGAHGFARLFIAEGRAPGIGQRAPVRFTLDPSGLNPVPVTIVGASLRRAGSSLSVDHAHQFCTDARIINR
ncbi:hypothetical protein OS190_14875 [Sulfitobacter sp. F26204]|uniref:hypothetical protein n=1 Tax=Sulfitobacter sp. F26204 TaxID=2996014 RepID=UPI00225E250E|nr:hypothetical protein [Sulfitobacter sp. F26204]MCX7560858.1 hypothetical protein [Sulfitobacter sp. F26204]